MNLKQIELQGFKSFQSKSVFKLDSNLIGIVGPNGSGKSNIIDAIRWVLGEQSAKNLRGSSMKDVIFSGTEEKRSKNFAEVSLTFSLKNDEDKIITRRLYRNGDSEYYLNGKKSKLKEITDVYFDLGINKESYSIITQGKVESILSSKAQDRRIIIEEAAGILKYKNKKKEANNKLDKTTDNIKRLNDIFIEVTARHNELLKQKEKANKYLEYNNELRSKDIYLKVYDVKYYQEKLEQLSESNDKNLKEKAEIDNNILVITEKLEQLKKDLLNCDNHYNQNKEEEIKLIKIKEQLQSLITLFDERNNNKNANEKKLNEDKKEFIFRKSQLEERVTLVTEDILERKNKLKILKNKLKEYDNINNNSVDIIDNKIEDLKEQYFNLINEETKLQNELTLLDKIKNNTNNNIEIVSLEINNLKNDIESKNKELNILKNDKIEISAQYEKLLENINSLEKEKIFNRENHRNLLEKINKGEELKLNFFNKKEFLENQNSNLNYYNNGVKEILKSNIEGVHSTVGDIINFDNKYTTALDIALSTTQQNIIVNDEHIARRCVDHLKKTGKGRATFLPLRNIISRNIPNNILETIKNEEGYIDIASNLVIYNNDYKSIISYLLGLVIIVDNLKNGNKLARKLNFKYRIVTLDGQIINSGGSVTGGAIYKNNNSIVKNKAELDEIANNLLQIDLKLEKLKQNLIEVENKLINNDVDLDNIKFKAQEFDILIKEITLKEQLLLENIDKLKNNLENEIYKLKDYEGENSKINSESSINEKLKLLKEQLQKINMQLSEENDRKQRLSTDTKLLQKEMNNLLVEKETLEESILSKNDYKVSLMEDLEYLDKQIAKVNENLEFLYKEETQFDKEENIEKLLEVDRQLILLQEKLSNLKIQKDNLYQEEEKLDRELKKYNSSLEEIIIKLENIKLQSTKLEIKVEQIVSYLVNTYNTTYEKVEDEFSDISIQEISTYKGDVDILKNKILELGNVNLDAIEEYEEIAKRYNFYKVEIDDLLQSKEKLQETIREIDKEVESRFLDTFEKVASNFDRIYKTLFNGGYAKMTLEEPRDILTTGINIEASPPGKKLQKLSLLSGGEKALTAISLLFAILEIRNSPFVILDEVEAALDEVNVLRFANFLKQYSVENQFLVITHRRGTMEQMDKLYGVTMKEKGVSYILPLELKNILEDNYINE